MQREIKFRGQRVDDKKWIYGNLVIDTDGKTPYIVERAYWNCEESNDQTLYYEVIYDSIGQYTGLKDKNGEEIYEGDIVEVGDFKYSIKFEIGSFMLVRCSDETDMYAEFDNCWNDDVYPMSQLHWESDADEDTLYNCEIVGNIYENPDLLEKGEE